MQIQIVEAGHHSFEEIAPFEEQSPIQLEYQLVGFVPETISF